MSDDLELLQRYVSEKSELAFGELVRRHLGFVYHAALRRLNGDARGAEEVAQLVFIDFARRAPSLAEGRVIVSWLHARVRHAVLHHLRTERRRRLRETKAHAMQDLISPSDSSPDWTRLRPAIDEALDALSPGDRQAVLLRFFEGLGFAEVGSRLNVSEEGARLRVKRALDKLHALLERRGITTPAGALAIALAAQAGLAAPTGLAETVATAALGHAGSGLPLEFGPRLFAPLAVAGAIGVGVLAMSLASDLRPWASIAPVDAQAARAASSGVHPQDADVTTIGGSNVAATDPRASGGLFAGDTGAQTAAIRPETAMYLDLDAGEIAALGQVFRTTQVRLRDFLDAYADVSAQPEAFIIRYNIPPAQMQVFEDRFETALKAAMDARSRELFGTLNRENTISRVLIGRAPRRLAEPTTGIGSWLGSFTGERYNLRVELKLPPARGSLRYMVEIRYRNAIAGETPDRSGTHLFSYFAERYYGNLVKKHWPQFAKDQAAAASASAAALGSTPP